MIPELIIVIGVVVAFVVFGTLSIRAEAAASRQYRERMDRLGDRMDEVIDKMRALRNPKG